MTLFIVGCVLAGLLVIAIPVFCIVLLKMERRITKLGWKFYLVMFSLITIGIAAVACIFGGYSLMQQ